MGEESETAQISVWPQSNLLCLVPILQRLTSVYIDLPPLGANRPDVYLHTELLFATRLSFRSTFPKLSIYSKNSERLPQAGSNATGLELDVWERD